MASLSERNERKTRATSTFTDAKGMLVFHILTFNIPEEWKQPRYRQNKKKVIFFTFRSCQISSSDKRKYTHKLTLHSEILLNILRWNEDSEDELYLYSSLSSTVSFHR